MNIGAATTSVTLSVTDVGLIVVPNAAGFACALSLGNNVLHEVIKNVYNMYKKQFEKDQQTIKSCDKLNKRSLQENFTDKNKYESPCNIFNKEVDEKKTNPLLEIEAFQ